MQSHRANHLEGIEPIQVWLQTHALEVDHVLLQDRTSPHLSEPLGRFNVDLKEWIANGDTTAEQLDQLGTPEVITRQVVGWMRAMAVANTYRAESTFRVRFYGPKGYSCLHSATFHCRLVDDDAPHLSDLPLPSIEEIDRIAAGPAMAATAAVYRNLGQSFQMLIDTQTRGYQRLFDQYDRSMGRVSVALEDANETVRRLSEALVDMRSQALTQQEQEMAAQRRAFRKQQERLENQDIAKTAIDRVTETVKTGFAYLKGVPPELVDVLEAIKDQPELVNVIKKPGFREMIKDERARSVITQTLSDAADDYAAPSTDSSTDSHTAGEEADQEPS